MTLSLNVRQKKLRKYIGYFCLFIVYTLYTIPIAKVAELTTTNFDSWTGWLFGDDGFEKAFHLESIEAVVVALLSRDFFKDRSRVFLSHCGSSFLEIWYVGTLP